MSLPLLVLLRILSGRHSKSEDIDISKCLLVSLHTTIFYVRNLQPFPFGRLIAAEATIQCGVYSVFRHSSKLAKGKGRKTDAVGTGTSVAAVDALVGRRHFCTGG